MTGFQLRQGDLDYFALLSWFHFLTAEQIGRYFNRTESSVNRRLAQLADQGLAGREQKTRNHKAIWHPTPRAITELIKAGRLASRSQTTWRPQYAKDSYGHKEHEIAISDVGLSLLLKAAELDDVAVEHFIRGSSLYDSVHDGDGRRYPVHPDAFLQLRCHAQHYYFLIEVDRGRKPLKRLSKRSQKHTSDVVSQMFGYTVYYERGAFAAKYGSPGSRADQWPFRVLITAETPESQWSSERRNNMMVAVIDEMRRQNRRLPGSSCRGYALVGEVLDDPYAAIWLREVDLCGILAWLESIIGKSLADSLPDTHRDVLAHIDEKLVGKPYQPPRAPDKRDLIRDALIESLLVTGRLKRYSILEDWPPSSE